MGEYKSLYRIKLRFFWPKLRSDIYRCIKEYSHYQLIFRWRCRGQELIFSWPLSIFFAIIHINLWMPGKYTNSKGNMALMNTMCDISQFVAVVPVPDESSATLTDHFFQHVLMKFGLCYLVF